VKLNPHAFRDGNIYWSFHSYEPFVVGHQGASWVEQNRVPASRIVLGEFGAIKKDQSTEVPEASRVLAEIHGMAWSAWSWCGSFAVTEEETQRGFILRALGWKTAK
jgi:hypothetical protein